MVVVVVRLPSFTMALLFGLTGGVGCHRSTPRCTGMSGVGTLVDGAVLLRLDVYDDGAHCADGLLAGQAAGLLKTQTFVHGQPITLSLAPGKCTLVLTTYADAGGRQALGQACAETLVAAGAELCFDLTLVPLAAADAATLDDAATLTDAATSGDAAAVACTLSPDRCPAGSYCSGQICVAGCKADSDCTGGATCDLPSHTCRRCTKDSDCGASGLACCAYQCVNTASDARNCGGCGNVCDTTTSSARSCSAGKCTYTCNAGLIDCDGATGPNLDGCECAGTACCGASCQVKHHTQVGQESATWPVYYDCNKASVNWGLAAQTACNRYAQANGKPACVQYLYNCSNPSMYCYDAANAPSSFCWAYGLDSLNTDYSGWLVDAVSASNCPHYANWD